MRWKPVCLLASAGVLLAWIAGPAAGQEAIPNDRFSADRFQPAPGGGNYLAVDGAVVPGHLVPTLGLLLDYAHRPFVLFTASCAGGDEDDCEVGDSEVDIVSYRLTGHLMGALSIANRVELGLVVPVIATSGESFRASTPALGERFVDIRGGEAFGLGDPRLRVKAHLVGRGARGFQLAAVAFATGPLGEVTAEGRFLGDESVTAGGHFAVEYGFRRLRIGANLGGVYRAERELLSTEIGPEMTYGLAGRYDATSLLGLVGEVTGATTFSSELDENPLEARVAAELQHGDIAVTVGGGVGLLSGVGVPNFRALAGVAYRPARLDSDGDGVPDELDKCPTELEDLDGYLDDDGCPDSDNDADGFEDSVDNCPDQPEDMDGTDDHDGCPEGDNDGDGIQDGYDSCPDEPEDFDGDRDDDGCPDDDRDRDGVPDDVDQCPNEPEDTDGFGDEDGCPEVDFDGDGIPDDEDFCPDEPEDVDGVEDDDGCPDVEAGDVEAGDIEPPSVDTTGVEAGGATTAE